VAVPVPGQVVVTGAAEASGRVGQAGGVGVADRPDPGPDGRRVQVPLPSQSPITSRSPLRPYQKLSTLPSELRSRSWLLSRAALGRTTPTVWLPSPSQSPTPGSRPSRPTRGRGTPP